MAEARAPGKLVICGEYAVLAGAPAIAMAVPVTATARVEPASADLLQVPGEGQWAFGAGAAGMPQWADHPPPAQGRVLEAVLATLSQAGVSPAGPLQVILDSREFHVRDRDGRQEKLGLGSSAAVMVALVAALLAAAGSATRDAATVQALALAAHRRFQNGGGSGIDVVTAVRGGVVALLPGAPAPVADSVGWPAGLHALALWSGRGAATTALLAKLDAFRGRDPRRHDDVMATLARQAGSALSAWRLGDAAAVLAALGDYQSGLRALDAAGGIGIWTDAHERLRLMAEAAGAVYKTSGAGGGDFGLAFAADPAVIRRLAGRCANEGVRTLPATAHVPGLALST